MVLEITLKGKSVSLIPAGHNEPADNLPCLTIADFRPELAFYKPNQPVRLLVRLQSDRAVELVLQLQVSYLNKVTNTLCQELCVHEAEAGQAVETSFELNLPPHTPRGYGFDLAIKPASRPEVLATASTAVDLLNAWPDMPRYGFFANFKADETAEESNARALALSAYHVNVVQFYDWMYRHEDFIPPQDDFIDPMGRAVSYKTVRNKIEAAHKFNMAALAYGAVYGATPGFWEKNQDWGIYQADGQPYSLEKLFYLMDISEGTPWSENILTQYEKAISQAGFDGIHIDQYGYPKLAFTRPANPEETPKPLELAKLFPPIIDEAARRVARLKPDASVIFNAVNNWPIETVATTSQGALYIEVWPPYVEYKDLHDLIVNAQQLANSVETKKQVILAAYLTPFLPEGTRVADNETTEEAPHAGGGPVVAGPGKSIEGGQNAALFATAAIYGSGGFHLLLGEKNGVLADPYYPHYGQFGPNFVEKIRRYYDFVVRYENILSNHASKPITAKEVEQLVVIKNMSQTIEISGGGQAGKVWAMMRRGERYTSINLVNLRGLSNSLWNAFKEKPGELESLELSLKLPAREAEIVKTIWFASPDGSGAAQELPVQRSEVAGGQQSLTVNIPGLDYWGLVVLETTP
ncbi:MAG: hypothetical protein JWP00_4513 [Chloroflexi bacterium]|nr:hypothetical protein [Chloroflexota bacterium]